MSVKERKPEGYVKTETLLVSVLVALLAGFLAGIVFSAYKSAGPGGTARLSPPSMPAGQQSAPPDNFSGQDANVLLALEQEARLNPDNGAIWTRLGNLYYDSGRHGKAIEAYNKSLALLPDNPNVLTDLGVMYRRNGQPGEAVKAFDRAAAVDPGHLQSRINKGIVLRYDLNDRAGAVKAWEEALQINPMATAPNGQPLREAIKRL